MGRERGQMPKIVDSDAYRLNIIQKTIGLFVEHGYNGLGMREIAKALAISKSALYHYFPTKEALFEGVVGFVVRSDIDQLNTFSIAGLSFGEKLAIFMDYIESQEGEYMRQYYILMDYTRLRQESDDLFKMNDASQQYANAIADFLGIELDEAMTIYLLLTGVILQRMLDAKQTHLRTQMSWVFDILRQKYSPKG
jgi:AcrR family transcriptional regulator